MPLTNTDRNNLQQLLHSLKQQGWLPVEVLLKGFWEHTPSIDAVLANIEECEPPVVRVMKGNFEQGFKSGILRLRFAAGTEGLIDDHTLSDSFPEAVELARKDLASPSSLQGAAA